MFKYRGTRKKKMRLQLVPANGDLKNRILQKNVNPFVEFLFKPRKTLGFVCSKLGERLGCEASSISLSSLKMCWSFKSHEKKTMAEIFREANSPNHFRLKFDADVGMDVGVVKQLPEELPSQQFLTAFDASFVERGLSSLFGSLNSFCGLNSFSEWDNLLSLG